MFQPAHSLPRIKLDLTTDELLAMPPVQRPVVHSYSDLPEGGIGALCYDYEEVFGEKIRALGERGRPRDLYDVVNLFRHEGFHATAAVILDIVRRKCAFKDVPIPTLLGLEALRDQLVALWQNMLAHQLPQLPPFESFWEVLPAFFAWLETGVAADRTTPYPMGQGEESFRPAFGRAGLGGLIGPSLEIVRFAAANHLCVDLDYQGSTRRIEPYSLRRTRASHILLYALRVDSGETRAYRVDRIQGAQVTQQTFTPRYAIELSPSGPLMAPSVATQAHLGTRPRPSFQSRRPRSGPMHIYECVSCGKQFRRQRRNSRLRPHKTKDGWPCAGRTAYYIDTRY